MKKYFYACCLLLFASSYTFAQKDTLQYQLNTPKNTYTSVFDQLQNNEQFVLNFSSSGCFHRTNEIMTFGKENDTYYVVFQKEQKVLSTVEIKAVQQFENELLLQNYGGCTTNDVYLITFNETQQCVIDGSCAWNGYYRLKKAVGFTSKQ
jgi:hypothetical protein